MLKFSSFLSEGNLGSGEIQKYDWRIELFLKKLKQGLPFETVDGKMVTLQYPNDDLEKYVKKGGAPRGYKFATTDGQELSFTKLQKTKEFGGGTSGSGAGSDNTTTTESAQCVYAQCIWDNPTTDFNQEEITAAYQKCQVNAPLKDILNMPEDWVDSSQKSAKLLYRGLKKKNYTWYRGMGIQSEMEEMFKVLNRAEKKFNNINKWSPADIWIVAEGVTDTMYDWKNARSLQYLNNELRKAYAERDIMGISLKKVEGRARLVQVNYKKPYKPAKFKSVSFGKRDFWKSKDGYIFYDGGEVQFRTFPTFQCEIIGKTAKHGKVSGGDGPKSMMGMMMTQVGATALPVQKDIIDMYRNRYDEFVNAFFGEYQKAGQKDDFDTFKINLKTKDDNWSVSKYLATLVFNNVKGKESAFINAMLRYAKSESAESAVHLKVK